MYDVVLLVHSWLRWLVLVVGVGVVVRGWWGWMRARPWSPQDERLGRLFPVLVDVQALLGAILFFFLSPDTSPVLTQGGMALGTERVQFWLLEHAGPMAAALILAHVGQAFIRRSSHDMAKHRWAAIVFGLALIIILLSIPWPFAPNGRPLFRI